MPISIGATQSRSSSAAPEGICGSRACSINPARAAASWLVPIAFVGDLLVPGVIGGWRGLARAEALLDSASAIFLCSISTRVLLPPPRNVARIECRRDSILLGRLSTSIEGGQGSMVSLMIESASEFAISYSFNSYTHRSVGHHDK